MKKGIIVGSLIVSLIWMIPLWFNVNSAANAVYTGDNPSSYIAFAVGYFMGILFQWVAALVVSQTD